MNVDKNGRKINAARGKQGFQETVKDEPGEFPDSVAASVRLRKLVSHYPTVPTRADQIQSGDRIIALDGTVVQIEAVAEDSESGDLLVRTSTDGSRSIDFVHPDSVYTQIHEGSFHTKGIDALLADDPAKKIDYLRNVDNSPFVLSLSTEDIIAIGRLSRSRRLDVDNLSDNDLEELDDLTMRCTTEAYYHSLPLAPGKPDNSFAGARTPTELDTQWEGFTSPEYLTADGELPRSSVNSRLTRLENDYVERRQELQTAYPQMFAQN